MDLRRATHADAAAMREVAESAYSAYLPRMGGLRPGPMDADYQAAVAHSEAWVADCDDVVVGLLTLVDDADAVLLENVAVLPSHHGHGIGRALLELAEERAVATGHSCLRLYTHVTIVENQRLYRRIGYVETRRTSEHGFTRVFYEKSL